MLKTHFRWGFSVQKDNYITKGPSNNRCWRYNELLLRNYESLATHCRSLNGYAFWVRKESLAWWIRTNENRIREWERKGIETMGPCKFAFTFENPCSNCLNLLSNFLLSVGHNEWWRVFTNIFSVFDFLSCYDTRFMYFFCCSWTNRNRMGMGARY